MQRNYGIAATERITLACCCAWLEYDLPVGPAKEAGDLVNEDLPGGIARDNLVAAAGELDVAGSPDSGSDKAAFAGGNDRLVARVKDECGAGDLG